MKKLICTAVSVMTLMVSVSALADPGMWDPRQAVVMKSERLAQTLRVEAGSLRPEQLEELDRTLERAMMIIGHGGMPVPPPAPVGPACEVAGAGYVNGTYYAFQIKTGGTTLSGASSLADLGSKLRELESARICSPRPMACAVDGAGYLNGTYYAFQVRMGTLELVGASSLDDLINSFSTLRQDRICLNMASQSHCAVQGAAYLNGTYYANIITLDGRPMVGAASLEQVGPILGKLRGAGLCQ